MPVQHSVQKSAPSPALVVLALGLFVMPVLSSVDFLNGHNISGYAKLLAFLACIIGLGHRYLGLQRMDHGFFAGMAILLMASAGALTKLDDAVASLWVLLLPVLFVFVGSVRQALIFCTAYLAIYVLSYLSFYARTGVQPIDVVHWGQVLLAYLISTALLIYLKTERFNQQIEDGHLLGVDPKTGLPRIEFFRRQLDDALQKRHHLYLVRMKIDDFVNVASQLEEERRNNLMWDIGMTIRDELPPGAPLCALGVDGFLMAVNLNSKDEVRQFVRKVQVQLSSTGVANFGSVSLSTVVVSGDFEQSALGNIARLQTAFYELALVRKNHIYFR